MTCCQLFVIFSWVSYVQVSVNILVVISEVFLYGSCLNDVLLVCVHMCAEDDEDYEDYTEAMP